MKKKDVIEAVIEKSVFPDTGVFNVEGRRVEVKHALKGQRIKTRLTRVRGSIAKGNLLEVLEKSPVECEKRCPHFDACGGCTYQNLTYEQQLLLKEEQMHLLLDDVVPEAAWNPIKGSPLADGYRNKMELTFGDEEKGGPLVLGLHKRGSMYDISPIEGCRIMDNDLKQIAGATQQFFRESGVPFYHRVRHEGVLRHLLLRKAKKTGEILVCLVTTGINKKQEEPALSEENAANSGLTYLSDDKSLQKSAGNEGSEDLLSHIYMWAETIRSLTLEGTLTGILHTVNDSLADVIRDDGTTILYGKDWFEEELLGLTFRITPFSFFQTNSLGAEVLYSTARNMLLSGSIAQNGQIQEIFDLYSGTGTIAQLMAPVSAHVTGVEIVEEAVGAARLNAEKNGLSNCSFIAGDVLKVLDDIARKPDLIILDPPRDGIHPKALPKILAYGVSRILYISCKPTSLRRDLDAFLAGGYGVESVTAVDMFPFTAGVEVVCLLKKAEGEQFRQIDPD